MKKRFIIGVFASLLAITSIASSILITSCSNSKINGNNNNNNILDSDKVSFSSIWKLDNKKSLYLEEHNLGNNLSNIKVYDEFDSSQIEINYNDSKINNKELFINFKDDVSNVDNFKIVNDELKKQFIIKNENTKTFNKYDLIKDQEYFFELIKEMSNNKIPTFGILRVATLALQQAFYISLVNHFNSTSDEDSIFLFGQTDLWNQNRINSDVLVSNNIWNGNKDENVDSYSKFNLFHNDLVTWQTQSMISSFNKILNKGNFKYFDFFHDDVEIIDRLEKLDEDYFNYLFKHANKLIIISDGAYHSATTIPKLEEIFKNHKPRSRDIVVNLLKDYQSGKIEKLNWNDILDIILLKNFESTNENSKFNYVSFVNYDSNIFNSSLLNDNNKFSDTAFSTNFIDYTKCINNIEKQKEYLDVFSKLFIKNGLTFDNVFINGAANYDPNKKKCHIFR